MRKVFFSDEDRCWVAVAPELEGCSALGDTAAEALKEFEVAIRLYLESLEAHGDPIPKPLSQQEMGGRLLLRLPKILQRCLKEDAAEEGISVNQYALYLIALARGQIHPLKPRQPLPQLVRDVSLKYRKGTSRHPLGPRPTPSRP
ncbi:MAG: type II toxin-antitoxin system HicB family antitoxin [Elusimicrobia bacterium]|nr:type II toxin-antitoxin system HicB family antitoxin [Elusimicrobiota bacterium]